MTTEEKLSLIEGVLHTEQYTLTEDTVLKDLPQWDSLNLLNFQIELAALRPETTFDRLHLCKTVGDICKML